MCGRYTCKSDIEEISEIIPGKFNYPEISKSYNIAPSQHSLIVTYADQEFAGRSARWGLLPPWLKGKANPFINARSETAFEKPSFKNLYKNNRCVAVADGFYEWVKRRSGQKQPVYFYLPDHRPFGFAGFHQTDQETGDETFVIMTAAANDEVKPVHDRMPVILDREGIDRWLRLGEREVIGSYRSGVIKNHFVAPIVNSPRNNSEECIIPYEESDQVVDE